MRDKFYQFLVKYMPKRLVYFASIRLMVNATTGQYSNEETPGVNIMDALKRWES